MIQLSEGLFSTVQYKQLLEYQSTLINWNRRISLTSVSSDEIMSRLILPSAWLGVEYSKSDIGVVVDFGAGAGIPGIPMAICDTRNRYLLVDSNQKKIGFIKACISSEGIGIKDRVRVRDERVGKGEWAERVNAVVTRGTGTILSIVELWAEKIDNNGHIDIFKGDKLDMEIEELIRKYPSAKCERIQVPEWFETLKLIRIKGVRQK